MNRTLIVVDMQNDFVTGSLPVPHAKEIIGGIIEKCIEYSIAMDSVLFTSCYHPFNHISFNGYGGTWPAHCVAGTHGAQLVEVLKWTRKAINAPLFLKGQAVTQEQYSAYTPQVKDYLLGERPELIEVCGLARNYCVQETYVDLKANGYTVEVLEGLCRSV